MTGWISDFFRLWWGLTYWNVRKTLFRLRGARGRPPCQDPSDSGRAFETHCDACRDWAKPARFRRVCPLLVRTPQGLRCSVNAADVRPFWSRAGAWFLGAAAALFFAATLAGFALLRGIGYPVSYADVALFRRGRIHAARAGYFLREGEQAYRQHDIAASVLAFTTAFQLDPGNYEAGMMLAGYWRVGQPAFSNALYAHLLAAHPEEAENIAQTWYRSLLAQTNFAAIEELAAGRLQARSGQSAAWIHALLFACRQTGDTAPLEALAGAASRALPWVRAVAKVELQIHAGEAAAAREALQQLRSPDGAPYLVYYRVQALLRLDRPSEALAALDAGGARLGDRERLELRLEVFHALGWDALVQSEFDRLTAGQFSTDAVELLSAYLIRHPDPAALDSLLSALAQNPLPATPDSYPATSALFCACGVAGDWPHMTELARNMKDIVSSNFNALDVAEAFFRGKSESAQLRSFLPVLQPLPMEANYALIRRFVHAPAKPPPPATP